MSVLRLVPQKKYFYCLFFCLFYCAQAIAGAIEDEYQKKVSGYNKALSTQEYAQAYKLAEDLLSIDPSDTLSLLRLVFISKMLNKQDARLIEEHMYSVAQSSIQEKELFDLIKAINQSRN